MEQSDLCEWFYFEAATFKKVTKIFEHIKIAKNIYDVIVESSYKTKLMCQNPPVMITSVNIGKKPPYQIETHKWMDW